MDKPIVHILPTFTYDMIGQKHLPVETHDASGANALLSMGADDADELSGEGTPTKLLGNLRSQGVDIDFPYQPFFSDGAPPEIKKK